MSREDIENWATKIKRRFRQVAREFPGPSGVQPSITWTESEGHDGKLRTLQITLVFKVPEP